MCSSSTAWCFFFSAISWECSTGQSACWNTASNPCTCLMASPHSSSQQRSVRDSSLCREWTFAFAHSLLSNNELCFVFLDVMSIVSSSSHSPFALLFTLSLRREGRGGQKLRSCWLKLRKPVQLDLSCCAFMHVLSIRANGLLFQQRLKWAH